MFAGVAELQVESYFLCLLLLLLDLFCVWKLFSFGFWGFFKDLVLSLVGF